MGGAVVKLLSCIHDIIGVSLAISPSVDLQDSKSIEHLPKSLPATDAVLYIAGDARF